MLVLTRRENDRIDFPGLGISIEVLRLTRARAALGIVAPKDVRIVRHELLAESGTAVNRDDVLSSIESGLAARIESEIDAASVKLKAAQEDLLAGNTKDALRALSEALADLDALRSISDVGGSDVGGSEQSDESSDPPKRSQWNVAKESLAGGVAESKAGYSHAAVRPSCFPLNRVLCVGANPDALSGPLADAIRSEGYELDLADDSLVMLYELARCQKPDAVLLMSSESDPDSIATVSLIRNCSQHPDVQVLFADDFTIAAGDQIDSEIAAAPAMVG